MIAGLRSSSISWLALDGRAEASLKASLFEYHRGHSQTSVLCSLCSRTD
jgi:hypothetical protein